MSSGGTTCPEGVTLPAAAPPRRSQSTAPLSPSMIHHSLLIALGQLWEPVDISLLNSQKKSSVMWLLPGNRVRIGTGYVWNSKTRSKYVVAKVGKSVIQGHLETIEPFPKTPLPLARQTVGGVRSSKSNSDAWETLSKFSEGERPATRRKRRKRRATQRYTRGTGNHSVGSGSTASHARCKQPHLQQGAN